MGFVAQIATTGSPVKLARAKGASINGVGSMARKCAKRIARILPRVMDRTASAKPIF